MRQHTRTLAALMLLVSTRAEAQPESCECAQGGTVEYQPTYVPFYLVNGDVGDALAHRGVPSGGFSDAPTIVLRALGMSFTHAAMLTADGPDGLWQMITQYNARVSNPMTLVDKINLRLDPFKLAHLPPGLESMSFDDFVRRYGYNISAAQVMKAATPEAGQRAAAATMGMDGAYRLQAFTDLQYMHHANPGTMCSGFIHFAWERSGAGRIPPVLYSPTTRLMGAEVIYQTSRDMILRIDPILADEWLADRMANQVVNCFLDIGCQQVSPLWKGFPNEGFTVGPDDLKPRAGNTAYTRMERAEVAGGYYTDRPWCRFPEGGIYPATCTGGNGGGGGGSGALPIAVVLTPEGTQDGHVSFTYALWDEESDLISVTVEYSLDGGGTWSLASVGPGGDPMTNLLSNPSPGVAHTFVWDTLSDFVGINQIAPNVQLRVTPSDGRTGMLSVTAPFVVDNTVAGLPCVPQPYTTAYCTDGACDHSNCEDVFTCAQDCGICGDGICSGGERSDLGVAQGPPEPSCRVDCGFCGDGSCKGGEKMSNCPVDCRTGCPDTFCDGENGENQTSCPQDCGSCNNEVLDPGETCETCPKDAAQMLRFTVDPPEPRPGYLVTFTAEASQLAQPDPSWDFGDGVHERGNPITHVYSGEGQFRVRLTSTENNCYTTVVSKPTMVWVRGSNGDSCGGTCGDLFCCQINGDETPASCPVDCDHIGNPTCGDDQCNGEESCETCPGDCGVCEGMICGDDICHELENCTTCPDDCGTCGGAHCGDDICQPNESCSTCPNDCGVCAPACGDDVCNGTETCETCPGDCGTCAPECGDDICQPNESCQTCPGDCGICAPECGDDICNGTETCETCPTDCGTCAPECGDTICNGTETCETCPGDCGACPTCGNSLCEADENCISCPGDCGACTP